MTLAYGGVPNEGAGCLRALARAKLTLSLRVTGRRPDGYHELEALVVSIRDPHDVLTIQLHPTPGTWLSTSGPAAGGIPAGRNNLDNLAARAALALLQVVDDAGPFAAAGLEINLHKEIPAGAGLGGGSADAAAVLRWAGCDDLAVAAGLGADVPFCLVGGRARVGGIGEVVEPLPFEDRAFTLLVPPLAVPTAEVYAAWDRLGGPAADGPNDLEPAALAVEPRLAGWRDRLAAATGRSPVLAGSGSAWFVEGEFPGEGRVVVRTARPVQP